VIVGHGEGNANVYRSGLLYSPTVLEINRYAGIKILGVPGRNYSIEAAPDVAGPWQTLTNLLLPNNPHTWIDYDSPSSVSRIYRVIEAPQPE
jgi:hypothetical protein